MTTAQTAFQALFANFAGLTVVSADKAGIESTYKIASLSEKIGSMKDGNKAEYVVLQRTDDESTVIVIHPNTAKKLFNKGEADGFKFAAVTAEDIAEVVELEEQAALQAELDGTEVEAEVVEEVKAEKGPSKKERALTIYTEVVSAGGARKEAIARFMSELGLSNPGASTYYQNCKKLWA